jgi:hypothetical protein
MQITIEVPDRLGEQLQQLGDLSSGWIAAQPIIKF